MKTVKETAPAICEQCGKVFETKYAFYCPECRKKIASERAKKIGLSELGHKARKSYNKDNMKPDTMHFYM